MLYTELATVRVRTEPAFIEFIETRIGCAYWLISSWTGWDCRNRDGLTGYAWKRERMAHFAHLLVLFGIVTNTMSQMRNHHD